MALAVSVLRDIQTELESFSLRAHVLAALALVVFVLLLLRMVFLQVHRYDDYAEQAEINRLLQIPNPPSRGLIYDRNGIIVANNQAAFVLEVTPAEVADFDALLAQLRSVMTITDADVKRYKRLREGQSAQAPVVLHSPVSDDEIARFAAQSFQFKGAEIKARLLRNYPYGELGSHITGYIGRINKPDMERLARAEQVENYRGSDHIGKVGLERYYEDTLHGQTGMEQVEKTAAGTAVRTLSQSQSEPGQSLHLSVDFKLQQMVEDLFGKRRGALVAMEPDTGAVLALVSKPTYNPNIFLYGVDALTWRTLNESIQKPLLNRAIAGTYPPGSTYKPFMALAALTTGARSVDKVIFDNGAYRLGNHIFRGHAVGSVDMFSSIVRSSNVYYYSLAREMGVDRIHDAMQPLGFGQRTGIDIFGEVQGILPSEAWRKKAYPKAGPWMVGETISLGIGQGANAFTPVQLATATAILVNGGKHITPHLVVGTENTVTRQRMPLPYPAPKDMGYPPADIDMLKRAMAGVAKSGTSARVFAGSKYVSGGKTGTAQAVSIGQNKKYHASRLSEFQRDHSWYIAFAPLEHPQIALAVIVENAGFGATAAAPIARRVIDYWLLGNYPSPEDIAAVSKGQGGAPSGAIPATQVPLRVQIGLDPEQIDAELEQEKQ